MKKTLCHSLFVFFFDESIIFFDETQKNTDCHKKFLTNIIVNLKTIRIFAPNLLKIILK